MITSRGFRLAVLLAVVNLSCHKAVQPPSIQVEYFETEQHHLSKISPLRVATAGYRAAIELRVSVDSKGNVTDVIPLAGPSKQIRAAVKQMRQVKYRPFERDGHLVPATFLEWIRVLPLERIPKKHVPFPEVKDRDAVTITLDRTRCYGSCPDYKVEIHGDGEVVYTGREVVVVHGKHVYHISADRVDQLVDLFRKADYYSLEPRYERFVTDCPTYRTSIAVESSTMSVLDYEGEAVGMPHAVVDLEDAIDRIADTGKWIQATPETVPALKSEGFDFHSQDAGRALFEAVGAGAIGTVRDMLAAGAPVGWKSEDGESALSYAVMGIGPLSETLGERREIVRMLIDAGASKQDREAKGHALRWAVNWNDRELLRMLLDYGADPNIRALDTTALIAAIGATSPDLFAEIMRHHPKVDGRDHEGNTALFSARTVHMAQALIKAGADVNARNLKGQTPVMMTDDDDITLLLIRAGANLSARDKRGNTAWDLASSASKRAIINRYFR